MKHLKLFEEIPIKYRPETKYKVGDYIFINIDAVKKHNNYKSFYEDEGFIPFGKIIDIDYKLVGNNKTLHPYTVVVIFEDVSRPQNQGLQLMCLREDEISRLLTQDEIDNYESKKEAFKYNL